MTARVAIIGGGIGGLATAWALVHRHGVAPGDILLLESAERLGGVVETMLPAGFVCETGPDSMLTTKPAGTAFAEALGLGGRLVGTRPEARLSLIARGDALVPVPEGLYLMAPGRLWPFAWSPIVSWAGKLRMGLDLVLPRRPADAPEESLAQFVRRRLGREALERIAQPLVGGIFTADPEHLSLAATMPQFPAMEREHRSLILAMRARAAAAGASGGAGARGPRYGLFATCDTGLEVLIEGATEALAGVRIERGVTATSVGGQAGAWRIDSADGRTWSAERLVLALPAHAAARLLDGPYAQLGQSLATIPYASIATLNLGWRQSGLRRLPLAAGFVVPAIEHRSLLACSFSHQKYPGRAPDGGQLLRAFLGGAMHAQMLELDDATLTAQVLDEVDRRFGVIRPPDVVLLRRWPAAMAQYRVGHLQRVAAIEAEAQAAGLSLVGNGYRGVGLPDVIDGGWKAAAAIATA
jgi:oxygen-dependent protoporphyrinogen oxidase